MREKANERNRNRENQRVSTEKSTPLWMKQENANGTFWNSWAATWVITKSPHFFQTTRKRPKVQTNERINEHTRSLHNPKTMMMRCVWSKSMMTLNQRNDYNYVTSLFLYSHSVRQAHYRAAISIHNISFSCSLSFVLIAHDICLLFSLLQWIFPLFFQMEFYGVW